MLEEEFLKILYENCSYCEGTGKDLEYLNTRKYNCYTCDGKGKRISYFGEELLKFIQDNIKIKIVT